MIKKRMRQGKVAGAKKGMWTNGRPPYPYVYNSATKQVEVDAEKAKIYRAIVDKYLLGMSSQEISVWLNRKCIAPPYSGKRNKYGWSHVTVYRLLISEIHLGYVIYGKTRNHRGTAQLVEKEDWIKVRGEHEQLKTEEEHELIMARIAQNAIIPRKCRAGILPLSGLLYCSKCGRRMQFKRRETSTKEIERFKREFKEMQEFSSPYILEVYCYIEDKNEYIMEYMDFTLNSYVEKYNSSLSTTRRKSIVLQILKAFDYIHSKGRLHRDISPKNILIKKYEDILVVKIADFGLVKIPDSSLTTVNTEFKGYFNDPSLIVDGFNTYGILHEIFALTRVVYYVMTGKTNIDSSDPNMRAFVNKGLNVDKSKRFKNISEMMQAFKMIG